MGAKYEPTPGTDLRWEQVQFGENKDKRDLWANDYFQRPMKHLEANNNDLKQRLAAREQELASLKQYSCEVCFTSSFAPCPEGTPNAVRDPKITDGWMVCQMCDCHEQLTTAIAAKEQAEQEITRQQELLKMYQDALEQIPCPNCKLYTDALDCPCACHVFPKDRVQHIIQYAEQALRELVTAVLALAEVREYVGVLNSFNVLASDTQYRDVVTAQIDKLTSFLDTPAEHEHEWVCKVVTLVNPKHIKEAGKNWMAVEDVDGKDARFCRICGARPEGDEG